MTAYKRRRGHYDPVWKRELPSAVDDAADVMSGYQKEFEFTAPDLKTARQPGFKWKPEDASPETVRKWNDEEGGFWAKYSLHAVAIATVIQVVMLIFMMTTMHLIDVNFGK